jgi:AcrR family transcriptional regulator
LVMDTSAHQFFRQRNFGKKKRDRTRGALLDSALSVFASKGFEGTRISDITGHADLANGTFYNYYQDKDQLLQDLAMEVVAEIVNRTNEEMSDISQAPRRVALAAAKLLKIARTRPQWLTVLLEGAFVVPEVHSATIQYMKQDLEMGVEQGHFSVTIDLLLLNQILSVIRVAPLIDPEMNDATIRNTCEGILRLVGMGAGNAAREVEAVFSQDLDS